MTFTRHARAPSQNIQHPSDRPMRKRPSSGQVESHVTVLAALAELMLGAAWADGDKEGVEILAIGEQLKQYVDAAELPDYVRHRMEVFDPKRFHVAAAAQELNCQTHGDRIGVLTLLVRVAGADDTLEPSEVAYLKEVAGALGLDTGSLAIALPNGAKFP